MSLLSENVIPGNHGKIFETNATEHKDLLKIKNAISNIYGVQDVLLDEDVFPKKITIHTSSIVSVKDIEDAVIKTGFHAIPKSLFEL
ncbi:heavy metal-associated domain-containing protein [Algibacter miyuki]|uniref:Heavy metal-associated domain-containing protein n=1 Tax=Algibacter miyuki TaxID=1306933 RepID=A0ABV5GWL8_9FLAO|nr:heavy metal-associated domain-containing protein [Algibacter miyuki]MDN3664269.1 heavy metal-associated domain-containing protein [Algibacter miyuki]